MINGVENVFIHRRQEDETVQMNSVNPLNTIQFTYESKNWLTYFIHIYTLNEKRTVLNLSSKRTEPCNSEKWNNQNSKVNIIPYWMELFVQRWKRAMCDAAAAASADGCVISFFRWNNVCFHLVCENFSPLLCALSMCMFHIIFVVVKSLRSFELSVRPTCVPIYTYSLYTLYLRPLIATKI